MSSTNETTVIPYDSRHSLTHAGMLLTIDTICGEAFPKGPRETLTQRQQAHHDRYVTKFRNGQLGPGEETYYRIAMDREAKGLVQPLPENPSI